MNTEQKLIAFETISWQMNMFAIHLTLDAAEKGGEAGKRMGIIAEEYRNLAEHFARYVNQARSDERKGEYFRGIVDIVIQMKILISNAYLVAYSQNTTWANSPHRRLAVWIEEIKSLCEKVSWLAGENSSSRAYTYPEIIAPIKSVETSEAYFFQYYIGGVQLIEHVGIISSLEYHAVDNGAVNIRGQDIPVIDAYKRLNLADANKSTERRAVMTIYPNLNYPGLNKKSELYAVLVDDLDIDAAYLPIGYNAPLEAGHAFEGYTRECWDAVAGGQLVFVDWEKFIIK